MPKVIHLPDNFIGKNDQRCLESFGGHTITHGRATRWHWDVTDHGADIFIMYVGGEAELLAVWIERNAQADIYLA